MKKLLFTLLLVCVLAYFATAQVVTTIQAVQDTTGTGSQDSPFKDQAVTVEGVVSAESWAFGGSSYYIQDGSGPWSGIMVYDKNHPNAYGDSVRITGTVETYYQNPKVSDPSVQHSNIQNHSLSFANDYIRFSSQRIHYQP